MPTSKGKEASPNASHSIGVSALSWLERLRTDDFQTDPQLKSEESRKKVIMLAACRDRAKLVRMLIDTGSDPNTRLEYGATPLMAAATWNSVDVCRLLLDAGAEPDFRDEEGMTALDMAVQMCHKDIIRMLEDAGAHRSEELAQNH
ncbi:MAG: ankyrin repeat domain-containing protein [bacterium]|nr:ankyrin repeat domain-containing protein [bacterium]